MTTFMVQELLDYIIDYLSDSPRDLVACAGVAKSWVYRAQYHIYRHLDLTPGSSCDDIEIRFHRLTHTLQNVPHLIAFIRSVSVPLKSSALASLSELPFSHLAEFRLECTSYPWAAPAQRETIAPLQRILRLPSLHRVTFWGYLEPIAIIDEYFEGCSRNIKHLRLELDNLDAYPGVQSLCALPVPRLPCPLPPIQKIELTHMSLPQQLAEWIRAPHCPFSLTRLISLEIRASDWVPLQKVLAPCLPQLEVLSLTQFTTVDLEACTGLRGLTIRPVADTESLIALLERIPVKDKTLCAD
ncbi:hypothetical protein C8R43DRAFT_271315 [Mycena crocata]|nr:hypothetical protein C8R43DRAFT_271315 [Mycena crocata]